MTIEEYSTQEGTDFAQIALDKYGVSKCTIDSAFHCFTIKTGEHSNIYILDNNDVQIHDGYFRWTDNVLAEGSSKAQVEVAFKAYIDAQEFVSVDASVVAYEELV